MDLTQYQQREQGFNQAMGAGFAAFSQPRDREWVSKIFNVNEPDLNKLCSTNRTWRASNKARTGRIAIGLMISGPQGLQIATALNMPGDTPAAKIAALQAAYHADPQNVGRMITPTQQPTPDVANLEQIQRLQQNGANSSETALLTPALIAKIGGPAAEKAIGDAAAYRTSHNGQTAPWVTPGGVDIDVYNRYNATQKNISDTQDTSKAALEPNLTSTDTLRSKLVGLQNNKGLEKILAAAADSPLKTAAWNAINSHDPNWQSTFLQNAAIGGGPDGDAMLSALSEIKEIQGQEYTGALHSLLGHGLRPTQAEIDSVRDGFGQTRNIASFGNIKDYTEQAIKPLLTRIDESQAEGYGSAGRVQDAPERLRPFIGKSYLTGGAMHLDDGAKPRDWESQMHRPVPPDVAAAAQAAITKQPKNGFAIRDGLRRQGYDVDF